MGKALYREHRPKRLAEVVGQTHITRALEKALKNNQISHAYLFTGPRGVGKTSIARILAHEVNGLPYDESATNLDIIEIDAASNRRIDEVRDLREKVHVAPSYAKYKVYIIDEVHMLTKEAFNALLKTLEEPPAHVIFILATTELHKLPETIISRTQHFAFRPISKEKVIEHLKSIAKKEKIAIDDEALQLLAEHGEGSFRDSISMLDQIRTYDESIHVKDVENMLGIAPETAIQTLVQAVMEHDAAQTVALLGQLHDQGIEAAILAKQLGNALRAGLLAGTYSRDSVLPLLEKLLRVPSSMYPAQALELALLDTALAASVPPADTARGTPSSSASAYNQAPKEPQAAEQEQSKSEKKEPANPPKKLKNKGATTTQAKVSAQSTAAASAMLDEAVWPQILAHIKQKYNTMYGVLRMAQPSFGADELTLAFKFAFHQKRMNDPKNKKIIMDAIHAINGTNMKVSCVVGETAVQPIQKTKSAKASVDNGNLSTISNIFGGAELLES